MKRHLCLAGLLSLVLISPLWAGVEQVSLKIKGMACPFCVFNIEKRVKTLEGIPDDADVTTDFDRGVMSFRWKPQVRFRPDALHEQVCRAGFTLGEIELTFAGTAARADEAVRVSSDASEQVITVQPAEESDRQRRFPELMDHLDDEPQPIRLEGMIVADNGTWHLQLHDWAQSEPADKADGNDD